MSEQAYIRLIDNHWAVVTGDGIHAEIEILAIGRLFAPGADIREAMVELEDWAQVNGFELTTPEYVLTDWSLEDLIEPEIFDDVFGAADEQP